MRGDLLERNALRRHATLMDFAAQFSSARRRAHSVVFRIAEAISFQLMPALLLGVILGSAAEGRPSIEAPAPPSSTTLQSLPMGAAARLALQTAIEKRDYSGAEMLLAKEIEGNPKSQPLLLFLANIFFLDGRYLNAAVALKRAERLAPLKERDRFLLSLAYISIDRGDWARPELEKLAQSNASNAVYPYWLSRLAYRKMDMPSAVALARKAVQLDPMSMKAYDQLGLCYEALNDADQAIGAYREAIRINRRLPVRSPWPSMNLGKFLFRLERLDEAEANLRESIGIDPRFPVAHFRLGQVLEKKKRLEEAIQEFQQAASLDPSYPEPHYALGRIYKARGDLDAAQKEWASFQELRKADKLKGRTRPD
jgi:tetratricopeptide (TPR) repeat protein